MDDPTTPPALFIGGLVAPVGGSASREKPLTWEADIEVAVWLHSGLPTGSIQSRALTAT